VKGVFWGQGLPTAPGRLVLYIHTAMRNPSLDLSRPVPAGQLPVLLGALDYAVPAGFPSPAEDVAVKRCDLIELLGGHHQSTFYMRVAGHSMVDACIHDQDIIVIDRAIEPRHGHIVVAVVDNEFTCKRLHKRNGRVRLESANQTFPDIRPREGQTLEIWGVVTAALTLFKP
jgi:DNA polymerase V